MKRGKKGGGRTYESPMEPYKASMEVAKLAQESFAPPEKKKKEKFNPEQKRAMAHDSAMRAQMRKRLKGGKFSKQADMLKAKAPAAKEDEDEEEEEDEEVEDEIVQAMQEDREEQEMLEEFRKTVGANDSFKGMDDADVLEIIREMRREENRLTQGVEHEQSDPQAEAQQVEDAAASAAYVYCRGVINNVVPELNAPFPWLE